MSDSTVDTWTQVCDGVRSTRALLAAERGSQDWLTTSMRCVDLLESLGHALEVQLFASAARPREVGAEALKALIQVRRGWEPSPLSAHVVPRRDKLRQAVSHLEVARLLAVRVAESGPMSAEQIGKVVVPATNEIARALAEIGKGFRSVNWNRRAVYLERRSADLRTASLQIARLTELPRTPTATVPTQSPPAVSDELSLARPPSPSPPRVTSRVPDSWRRSARRSPQAW